MNEDPVDERPTITSRGTLKDVAQLANVSVSTASRALSGAGLVRARTEKLVKDAAAALQYRPNTLARGLKTQRSRLIGVLVHNLMATSYRLLAETAQQRFAAAGFQVILGITGDNPVEEARFLTSIEDFRVEGLIIVPTGQNSELLSRVTRIGIPIVAAIRSHPEVELETILQADAEGAYVATKYLIELGHRRIGCIAGRDDTTSGRERKAGYRRAFQEAGLDIDPSLIVSGPYAPETGTRGCEELMALPVPPTALFVTNHEASMGVIKTLAEMGKRIPDELSLICYEDIPWLKWQKPAVSIVDNNAEAIANLAVDALMRVVVDKGAPRDEAPRPNLRVEARLQLRDSCAPPKTDGWR
ncbi:MAG: LacI family DNA-binding transcriptional regulator [Parvibaculaceae bacterium]